MTRIALALALTACATETVTLSGTALSDEDGTGGSRVLAGATVSATGPVQATLTTNAEGRFSLDIPPGSLPRLHIQAHGHTGLFEATPAPETDTAQIYALYPEPLVDGIYASLGLQRDPAMGILVVDFATPSTLGGESASIDLPSQAAVARDDRGAFVLGSEAPAGGDDAFVGFLDVEPGLATVTLLSPEGLSCSIDGDYAAIEVFPNTVTTVRASCTFR